MKALDVLLYIFWLLQYCNTLVQTPSEAAESQQHIMHLYILYLELDRQESKVRNRRFWVRPIFSVDRRRAQGASENLIYEMETADREKYFNYLRMNKKLFNKLLKKVQPHIEKQFAIREPVAARTRLHICLRYLASGDSMHSISYQFRVSPSLVSKIVRETCTAIWVALKPTSFPRLTTEGWLSHARNFDEKWNFPHCIGAADGKLVVMEAPPNSGSSYYAYKQRFSLNLMAIADANYRFIAVDIGAPGRRSDGGVFKESKVGRKFEAGTIRVPAPAAVSQNGPILPYVVVSDEAFALSHYMMRPYPRSGNLNVSKKIFNYRLSRARRVVESAFGILCARWRIYRKEITGSVNLVRSIIQATTCLHNWLITESLKKADGSGRELYSNLNQMERAQTVNGMRNFPAQAEELVQDVNYINATEIRNEFANYFQTDEGSVPWQLEKILNNDF